MNFGRLAYNERGRDFIVGDIEGQYEDLDRNMNEVNFDIITDRLITVGNIINRGPDSLRCLRLLNEPWFFTTRGRAEVESSVAFAQMLTSADLGDEADVGRQQQSLIGQGARWLLDIVTDAALRQEVANLLQGALEMPLMIQVDTQRGFVGVVPSDFPTHDGKSNDWMRLSEYLAKVDRVEERVFRELLFGRTSMDSIEGKLGENLMPVAIDNVDRVYSGNIMMSGAPYRVENRVYINTGSVFGHGPLFMEQIA